MRRGTKRRGTKRNKTMRKRKSGGGLMKTIKAKLQKRKEKKAEKKMEENAARQRKEIEELMALNRSNARSNARYETSRYVGNLTSQSTINANRDRNAYEALMSGKPYVYDD